MLDFESYIQLSVSALRYLIRYAEYSGGKGVRCLPLPTAAYGAMRRKAMRMAFSLTGLGLFADFSARTFGFGFR